MSDMNGNPHVFNGPQIATPETINEGFIAEEGISFETVILSELTRNTEATLALAYEQRTANLIAYVDKIDDTSAATPVVNEIKARLGLNEGATK